MHTRENESKKNIKTLTIGFGLIVFVVALFFLKNNFSNYSDKNDFEVKIENQEEKKYSGVSTEDLLKKINSNEKIIILDLRSAGDFEKEHILDAKNISPEDLEKIVQTLDKSKEIVLVDDLGATPQEMQVLDFLSANEFEKTAYLEGGFFAWKNQLKPAVSMGDPASFSDQSKVVYIKSEELKNLLSQKNNLYIIDLRAEKEFYAEHIVGSINMNISDLEKRRREIPVGREIVIYGSGNTDSFLAQLSFLIWDFSKLELSLAVLQPGKRWVLKLLADKNMQN